MNLNSYPLVSFIIPFYNHNHFIKKTLDSILEDTYPNKEIIIINDGSSDPNDNNIVNWIVKNSNNISVNYIKRENKGVSRTMNELISLSKGKYIVSSASDDYFINNTIEKRVKILEKNQDKLLLLSDTIVVNKNNDIEYDSSMFSLHKVNKSNYLNSSKIKNEIIGNWILAGSTTIARKDLYIKVGMYDENLIVEDYDFFLRVVSQDLLLFYDEKVSAYRRHDTNVSGDVTKRLQMYQDMHKTLMKNSNLFDNEYKDILLKLAKKYEKKIFKEEHLGLFVRLQRKTRPFRYKIKNFLKLKR